MPRISSEMRKVTVRLFESDITRLKTFYPEMGYNIAIREVIHRHLNELDKKLRAKVGKTPLPEFSE